MNDPSQNPHGPDDEDLIDEDLINERPIDEGWADGAPIYRDWIAHRRTAPPLDGLTDRVMNAVQARSDCPTYDVRLAIGVNQSWSARFAACATAMLVGSLPFLFVARMAKLLVF